MKNEYKKFKTKVDLKKYKSIIDSMVYGDGTGLMYGGKEIRVKRMVSDITYFNHIYSMSWRDGKSRHACLRNGYWCWINLLRHPLDMLIYFKLFLRQLCIDITLS